jgi:hypothetical protein
MPTQAFQDQVAGAIDPEVDSCTSRFLHQSSRLILKWYGRTVRIPTDLLSEAFLLDSITDLMSMFQREVELAVTGVKVVDSLR